MVRQTRRAKRRAQRGGSERSGNTFRLQNGRSLIQNRIREMERLLELDRKDLEKMEDAVGSLEQDVDVLRGKMREQAPNNRAARGQLLDDLTEKQKKLREERRWRDTYRQHVEDDERRLRVLRRSLSNATA